MAIERVKKDWALIACFQFVGYVVIQVHLFLSPLLSRFNDHPVFLDQSLIPALESLHYVVDYIHLFEVFVTF